MLFLPIRELEIFDQVSNGKEGLLFSVRVDGKPIYGCGVLEFDALSSGSDIVGAFEDDNRQSLVAWIDPADGRFITLKPIWGFTPAAAMATTAVCGIAILVLVNMLAPDMGLSRQAGWGAAIVASLAGMAIVRAIAHRFALPSPLELALRQQLENHLAGRAQPASK